MNCKRMATWLAMVLVLCLEAAAGPPAATGPTRDRTLSGEAVVATDARGRIFIALDTAGDEGLPADGRMDHLFLFSPDPPVEQNIFRVVETADVVYSGRRVVLTSPDSGVRILLSVGPTNGAGERVVGEDSIRVTGGRELVHLFGLFETSIRGFSPERFPALDPAPEELGTGAGYRSCDGGLDCSGSTASSGAKCRHGGPRASSCEVKCTESTGCGVSCDDGSFACCNCWWPTGPECTCIPLN